MSARGRMTMRADVERNTASGTDAHGHPVAPVFAAHETIPCFVWFNSSRDVVDGDKQAIIKDARAMFPLKADVTEADEIASIKDRKGNVIIAGRFSIDAIEPKHDHVEALLERVHS